MEGLQEEGAEHSRTRGAWVRVCWRLRGEGEGGSRFYCFIVLLEFVAASVHRVGVSVGGRWLAFFKSGALRIFRHLCETPDAALPVKVLAISRGYLELLSFRPSIFLFFFVMDRFFSCRNLRSEAGSVISRFSSCIINRAVGIAVTLAPTLLSVSNCTEYIFCLQIKFRR